MSDSLVNNIMGIFRKMRLLSYKDMFGGIKEKSGSLSATEAFSADIINIMGEPTVTEFANYIGISQPNATYKINSLVSKGYIVKSSNVNDRREIHLKTGDKFNGYFKENISSIENAFESIRSEYSDAELYTASKVLNSILTAMDKQINMNKGEK